MSTKVKGDKIKEGSIPLSALSKEIQQKIGHYWYISYAPQMYFNAKDFIEEFGIWFPEIKYDNYEYRSECEIFNKVDFCNKVFYTVDGNENQLFKIIGINNTDIFIYDHFENKICKYKLYMTFMDETENFPIGVIFERVN